MFSSRRPLRRLVKIALPVVVVGVAAAVLIPTADAAEQIGGVAVVAGKRTVYTGTAQPFKEVLSRCPEGMVAIGGQVLAGDRVRRIVGYRPSADGLHTFLTAAANRTGSAPAVVTAQCAAERNLPGLMYVEKASPQFGTEQSAEVTCPGPRQLIGFGGYVDQPGYRHLRLTDVFPTSGTNGVTATAVEDSTGDGRPWSVVATAVCAFTAFTAAKSDLPAVLMPVGAAVQRLDHTCGTAAAVQAGWLLGPATVGDRDAPGVSAIIENSDGSWTVNVVDDLRTRTSAWAAGLRLWCLAA